MVRFAHFYQDRKKHSKHTLDTDLTNKLVKEAFQSIPKVSLVPGFISSDKTTGDVTNLGRGGSDYTAAIICGSGCGKSGNLDGCRRVYDG